jgi:hypothetical protein
VIMPPKEENESADMYQKRILSKTMHTLKILMKLLAIDFYYQRIHNIYKDKKTMHCVLVLLNRCRKLYSAIEHLNTIFRLLILKELDESTRLLIEEPDNDEDKGHAMPDFDARNAIKKKATKASLKEKQRNERALVKINERLLCAIKGFLTEHTLFPV